LRVAAHLSHSGRLALLILLTLTASAKAAPVDCSGNSNVLGVSRALEIDPTDGPRYGTYQYPSTLALEPKEVVLTFDDGPDPKRTPKVLDALDQQCVKATFFEIGRWAEAYPEVTKEVVDRGNTLASHSWSHPPNLGHLKLNKAKEEIDHGFAALKEASGNRVAPFFRYPGLNDSTALNDYLAQSRIAVISCDIGTDDWMNISAKQIVKRALARLAEKGKGIILLHDRKRATVKALPDLLVALKERGYHVVQIVPKVTGVASLGEQNAQTPPTP
jgi:peptidoglycan/xylan/chitin deacetylase (PgdA/CDA1 family)